MKVQTTKLEPAIYFAEKCLDHKHCGTLNLNEKMICEQTQQKCLIHWKECRPWKYKCEFAFDENDLMVSKTNKATVLKK